MPIYSHELGAISQGLAAGILSAMSGQLNNHLSTQLSSQLSLPTCNGLSSHPSRQLSETPQRQGAMPNHLVGSPRDKLLFLPLPAPLSCAASAFSAQRSFAFSPSYYLSPLFYLATAMNYTYPAWTQTSKNLRCTRASSLSEQRLMYQSWAD